ncbi:MAG: helicase-related protein [Bacteroidota bacterium]
MQVVEEGKKFGVECEQSRDGKFSGKIIVTNYERLHYFDPAIFSGMVCDESSILKNFDGSRKQEITEFMRKMPFRLLCTATAAPNDYIELGTSSEALGEMGYMDMLNYFFKNDQNNSNTGRYHGKTMKWRFKKHAEIAFWQWVSSWARALRKPSDLGFDDGPFILPSIVESQHEIKNTRPHPGKLFVEEARNLQEQREELRMTLNERCEKTAEIATHDSPIVIWCHLNDEANLLEKQIPGAVQVAGRHPDEKKEERLSAFSNGEIRALVTKPKIAGFGLNWQHCSHMTFFPSHSYEQYYQAVRRLWRFGQKNSVRVDIVTTPGMKSVLNNLQHKAKAADEMFSQLVKYMNDSIKIERKGYHKTKEEVPAWL